MSSMMRAEKRRLVEEIFQCHSRHARGSQPNFFSHLQEIILNHTFNAGQIAWFKAGSALNHMKVNFEHLVVI